MVSPGELKDRISSNLKRVREGVAEAAIRHGRDPADILLLGVTKYSSALETRCLVELGCCDLAESRPQDLWKKAEDLADLSVRWHFIGHLQRNKVRKTLPLIHLMHSLDSHRLLEELVGECQRASSQLSALIEVNVSGDANKTGLPLDELPQLIEAILAQHHVQLAGLMGMAPLGSSSEDARRCFASLRQLRDTMQQRFPEANLSQLSMGMSGDYREAIAEGSTVVRIGSALFEA